MATTPNTPTISPPFKPTIPAPPVKGTTLVSVAGADTVVLPAASEGVSAAAEGDSATEVEVAEVTAAAEVVVVVIMVSLFDSEGYATVEGEDAGGATDEGWTTAAGASVLGPAHFLSETVSMIVIDVLPQRYEPGIIDILTSN